MYRTKPISLRLPTTMLDQIDERAKERGLTRTAWIQHAITFALASKQGTVTETTTTTKKVNI